MAWSARAIASCNTHTIYQQKDRKKNWIDQSLTEWRWHVGSDFKCMLPRTQNDKNKVHFSGRLVVLLLGYLELACPTGVGGEGAVRRNGGRSNIKWFSTFFICFIHTCGSVFSKNADDLLIKISMAIFNDISSVIVLYRKLALSSGLRESNRVPMFCNLKNWYIFGHFEIFISASNTSRKRNCDFYYMYFFHFFFIFFWLSWVSVQAGWTWHSQPFFLRFYIKKKPKNSSVVNKFDIAFGS